MYLDFLVNIPISTGKITYRKKGDVEYVYFEYDRIYKTGSNITNPKRVTIGKRDINDPSKMIPNENYLKYFSDENTPEISDRVSRSGCLRIGSWLVIRKIIEEYKLTDILGKYIKAKELGLVLDLAAYSIISEDNANQYYPDYAYNHPLFSNNMHIYSDSKVSDLLQSMTVEMSVGFLNDWNAKRDHREKNYISYDSTNKNCQAGDIEIVEFGYPKVDMGAPVFNYAIAYDTENKEPLFYEEYSGSINDVSQLQFMVDKAAGYGYKRIGFILDRGYFSRSNLRHIDEHGYSFVMMVKGMSKLVSKLILENKGKFENRWANHIDDYDVYGITIKEKLYDGDAKDRYIHLYHSSGKEADARALLTKKIRHMRRQITANLINTECELSASFLKYFTPIYEGKTLVMVEDNFSVIEEENGLSGYFCIITSENMTAKEAITLYKSRDSSEKLFRGDKSYLGDKSLRVYGDSAADSKIFIEFIALIIRNKIYNYLMAEKIKLEKHPNFMTVPAALKELDKIEMVRLTDNKYHLDHAITATQKTILKAFGMDAALVKHYAEGIAKMLEEKEK